MTLALNANSLVTALPEPILTAVVKKCESVPSVNEAAAVEGEDLKL